MERVLPTEEEVAEIVAEAIDYVRSNAEEDDGLDLTIATNGGIIEGIGCADWGFQTGDNSYTGSCYRYRYWAVTSIFRDTNPLETARELIEQLDELIPLDEPHYDLI